MNFKFKTNHKNILADTTTPVSMYLRLRDTFPNSLLLESSEYHSRDNNISYICCQPIAGIVLENENLTIQMPDGSHSSKPVSGLNLREEVSNFRKSFQTEELPGVNVISNGIFG